MAVRAEVDKDVCISSGRCVADAPSVFRFDDDELSEVAPDAPTLPEDELREIARGCPSGAIELFDGSEPVPID